MDIKNNYLEIKNKIKDHKNVTLIAVSKGFAEDKIKFIYNLGQKDFGENYVNEFLDKKRFLADCDIRWHFIGHLQSNKVEKIVGNVDLIHSVDSLKLLNRIADICVKKNCTQKVLLQVKFGDEQSKSGFLISDLDLVFKDFKNTNQVLVCGLMTILPLGILDIEKKKLFQALQSKIIELKSNYGLSEQFKDLSMGMTDDFMLAISEGSTMIRVGRAIFGERI